MNKDRAAWVDEVFSSLNRLGYYGTINSNHWRVLVSDFGREKAFEKVIKILEEESND